jgi:hypothetical protein
MESEYGVAGAKMAALPPKADMCGATRDVRYGPIAEISHLKLSRKLAWQQARQCIGQRLILVISAGISGFVTLNAWWRRDSCAFALPLEAKDAIRQS